MKDNFLKSWKTTLLGLTILGLFVYSVLSEGTTLNLSDLAQLIPILSAVGFIFSKDATTSHSKGIKSFKIDNPNPKKEEK
ncbi:hypothetical protein [Tenacibaculum finnmarkense]|uniref:hypothetical protein n=1 Tax=Tenacibaculum finnmarkense TaxID=2781243 RepID=UPI00207ACA82|nr:hypothetical protein [Tenacibaculum finnmarkense]MCM8906823.1 hypothetical protein [Tenacibaculum finnmarkense genomovar finnmarkense]